MVLRYKVITFFAAASCILLCSFFSHKKKEDAGLRFPYREEGLSDRQAAAHLLNRFTYGPRPGQVDELLKTGLENWFEQQLAGKLADPALDSMLVDYDCIRMTTAQVVKEFPKPLQVARMAKADGVITDDSLMIRDEKKYRETISNYIKSKNFRPQSELYRQFFNAKVLRSSYSNNQLHEVMTEFWYNHFNVSMTKRSCALFIPNYERDAIRPFVTGRFEDMLLATAKSPAMLIYLDNFISAGNNDDFEDNRRAARRMKELNERAANGDTSALRLLNRVKQAQRDKGLNENYAREVMELHTLGVDGGYTQQDVTEAARVLTGWTIYPMEDGTGAALRSIINKIGEDKLSSRGFVREGDFFFAANRHDSKPKIVLGRPFDAQEGYQEGVDLLRMLAKHTSTARFISKKLATRFVSDDPPKVLVERMAKTFLETNGQIKEVLKTMVNSREFWAKSAIRSKTKSPFELAISAIRALHADVDAPYQIFRVTDKMGQRMYHYAAPTGFPDKAAHWINSGALLNRMNFGMTIAGQQVRGISADLLALNNNHEPESATDALVTYCRILLPERDPEPTIKRLTPLLTDPTYASKLNMEAGKVKQTVSREKDDLSDVMTDDESDIRLKNAKKRQAIMVQQMLAQVVGIILGSPEFQRK